MNYKEFKKHKIETEFNVIIDSIFSECSFDFYEDPHLPAINYDGDKDKLYEIMKDFIYKVENIKEKNPELFL